MSIVTLCSNEMCNCSDYWNNGLVKTENQSALLTLDASLTRFDVKVLLFKLDKCPLIHAFFVLYDTEHKFIDYFIKSRINHTYSFVRCSLNSVLCLLSNENLLSCDSTPASDDI